jgi:hypothetical protein
MLILLIINSVEYSAGTTKEISMADKAPEEQITDQLPGRIDGFHEDEAIGVRIHAEYDTENQYYKTTIVFTNKTMNSMDIVADCGLFISKDHFEAGTDCPAVESMLVKKNSSETQIMYLPGEFFNKLDEDISVKYRQGQTVKVINIQMKETKSVQAGNPADLQK